jgi:hypothetical protein
MAIRDPIGEAEDERWISQPVCHAIAYLRADFPTCNAQWPSQPSSE